MEGSDPIEIVSYVFVAIVTVSAIVLMFVWHFTRAHSLLDQWALDNGFTIIHREHRSLRKGPFFWTTSDHQAVYYIVVRDSKGIEHSGYARCGGWFWGMMRDKVDVRWDR